MPLRVLLLVVLVGALVSCGGTSGPGPTTDSSPPGTVRDLASVDQLSSALAADKGVVRLILVLSPT